MAIPTLKVEVDWENDNEFLDANEDVTADVEAMRVTSGRAGPLGPVRPTALELTLSNDDQLYAPENSSGALFGKLKPRRRVQIRTTAPSVQPVFVGRIVDIVNEPALDARLARIECLDMSAFELQGARDIVTRQTSTAPILEPTGGGVGPLTGVAVGAVLDKTDWDVIGSRSVDAGITEMDTYAFKGSALAALAELVIEEHGLFYVGMGAIASGKSQPAAVFEDRSHRFKTDHLTSQATYSDAVAAALRYDDFAPLNLGIEQVFNIASGVAQSRVDTGSIVVWTLGEIPELSPGESRDFYAEWQNPGSNMLSTAMTANTKADGSGDDKTADVTKVNATPDSLRWKVTLTNNASVAVFITALTATGHTRQPTGGELLGTKEDASSQTDYGERVYGNEPRYLGKSNRLQDWLGYIIGNFALPVSMVKLSFVAYDDTLLSDLLARRISDRVTIVNAELGLNSPFYIEGIQHTWIAGESGDKAWKTTLICSKIDADNQYWILGDSVLSKLGTSTRLFG